MQLLFWSVREDFCLLFCDGNFEFILHSFGLFFFLQILFSCGNEYAWIKILKVDAYVTNSDIDELRGSEVQYKMTAMLNSPF